MPRGPGKIKIQWIQKKASRQSSFRKRRATLFQKAEELSILCSVTAAVVVYGPGEAEPKVWPGVEQVTEILRRYRDLPDAQREAHKLDNEGFVRQGMQRMKKKVDNCKASARELEVNLVLNDVDLGRRRNFDDVPPELTAAVVAGLDALRDVIGDRVKFLKSEAAQEELPPPLEEAAALMALQEPPMVQPLAVVPGFEPVVPPPPPPQEEEKPPVVPRLAMAAPMVGNVPLLLSVPPGFEHVVPPPQEEEKPPVVPRLAMAASMVGNVPLVLSVPPGFESVVPGPAMPIMQSVPPGFESVVPQLAMAAPMVANLPVVPSVPPGFESVVPPPAPQEKEPAMVPPKVPAVVNAPVLLPAPAPPQSEPVVAPAPLPKEPRMVTDAPLVLPAPEPEPQAPAAGVGVDDEPLNLDYEPRNGSFLLEMADAIIDDGSGRLATAEDVDRLLREHGLEHLKPPM